MSCLTVLFFLLLIFGGLLGKRLFLASLDGLPDLLEVHGALVVVFHYVLDENRDEVPSNVIFAVGRLLVVESQQRPKEPAYNLEIDFKGLIPEI